MVECLGKGGLMGWLELWFEFKNQQKQYHIIQETHKKQAVLFF